MLSTKCEHCAQEFPSILNSFRGEESRVVGITEECPYCGRITKSPDIYIEDNKLHEIDGDQVFDSNKLPDSVEAVKSAHKVISDRYSTQFNDLLEDILGVNPHKIPSAEKEFQDRIDALGREFGPAAARFLRIEMRYTYGKITLPQAIAEFSAMRADQTTPDRMRGILASTLARLLHDPQRPEATQILRQEAANFFNEQRMPVSLLTTFADWSYVLLQAGRAEASYAYLLKAEAILDLLSEEQLGRPITKEIKAQLKLHRARFLFFTWTRSWEVFETEVLAEAKSLYGAAINEDPENTSRIAYRHIFWAQTLQQAPPGIVKRVMPDIRVAMQIAANCYYLFPDNKGRAYFHNVQAVQYVIESNIIAPWDSKGKNEHLQTALRHCKSAIDLYNAIQHPAAKAVEEFKEIIVNLITMGNLPRKIFLSHKGSDKPRIREFKKILELLQYEPWLDEDAMAAGLALDRAILDGMKDSCAAVFFITPSFKDESFIQTEINYAIQQKRSKGDKFSIITLQLGDGTGDLGVIPDLLLTYVYKTPPSDLEALVEIVRALPIKPCIPQWPPSP